ncbi:MAG: hypothetical protein JO253_07210 [Alphaproteobacteria bacterium]|nr:hypothetical protein [Alphaproteobacteria bacterium]
MVYANTWVTYAELTVMFGDKAASELLLTVERHANDAGHDTAPTVVYLSKNLRWDRALATLDRAA